MQQVNARSMKIKDVLKKVIRLHRGWIQCRDAFHARFVLHSEWVHEAAFSLKVCMHPPHPTVGITGSVWVTSVDFFLRHRDVSNNRLVAIPANLFVLLGDLLQLWVIFPQIHSDIQLCMHSHEDKSFNAVGGKAIDALLNLLRTD